MSSPRAPSLKRQIRPVIIGGSAGSLEPLRSMLGRVRHDSVSYIVSTHLSPTWDSKLAEVLQKYSELPVHKVIKPTTLHPNHVYVGGEGVDLILKDGKLWTEPNNRNGPRRSIDRLMFTAAAECGARAIGVILSGYGQDGADGLEAIRAAGGITMVQTPESAEAAFMPRNAQPFAQYCLPPEALGDQLMLLLHDNRPVLHAE